MSSDLVAWIVAITLGIVVVALGWRRNLGETTRNWLPRFEGASEQAAIAPTPSAGGQRRRPLSPQQRRWLIGLYLLLAILNVSLALPGRDDRLLHAIAAALFALSAVALWLRKWHPARRGSD